MGPRDLCVPIPAPKQSPQRGTHCSRELVGSLPLLLPISLTPSSVGPGGAEPLARSPGVGREGRSY